MRERLTSLQQRGTLTACGVMSGTSLDGLDIAVADVTPDADPPRIAARWMLTEPYDTGTRELLLQLQDAPSLSLLARASLAFGRFIGRAVIRACTAHALPPAALDVIGSHGQTIHHAPAKETLFGERTGGTLQLGDPAAIAAVTGVTTVGDFRIADCALGGEGAPLMPFVDFRILRSATEGRVALNIGGIANVTILPRACTDADVRGWDCGPGNMVMDELCRRADGEAFDRDGRRAAAGTVIVPLLARLDNHPFLAAVPPKSTGRETFGAAFVDAVCSWDEARGARTEDLLRTTLEWTVGAIARSIRDAAAATPLARVILSGGGAHNAFLVERLALALAPIALERSDAYGMPVDGKEALGFAFLACEALRERPASLPAVTGATRGAVLGKICL